MCDTELSISHQQSRDLFKDRMVSPLQMVALSRQWLWRRELEATVHRRLFLDRLILASGSSRLILNSVLYGLLQLNLLSES